MSHSGVSSFFCIGAAKAGTSWLHHNLKQHPEIWLPPVKELSYFDTGERSPLIFHVGRRTRSGTRAMRGLLSMPYARTWALRFLLLPRNDQWYASLFQPTAGQIYGEVNPAYAKIDEEKVAHVSAMFPDAKIIYLLRGPVERTWSQAKMQVKLKNRLSKEYPSEPEMQAIMARSWEAYAGHGDYLGNLPRWQKYYPPDRLMIGFFEQLIENPTAFLKSVFHFLEVSANDQFIPSDVAEARNQRRQYAIPASIHDWLTERLYPQIEALHSRFCNAYTEDWLQRAQTRLKSDR